MQNKAEALQEKSKWSIFILLLISYSFIIQSCCLLQNRKASDSFTITFAGPFVETKVRMFFEDNLMMDTTLTAGTDGVAHSIFSVPSPKKDLMLKLVINTREYYYTVPKRFDNYLIIDYFPNNVQFKLSDKDFPRM